MLVLASSSPRRRALLASAGIEFRADPADVDESRIPGEAALEYARRLALAKAQVVASRHDGQTILGADTIVVVEGEVLGKPVDAGDAQRMLRSLSGRVHEVITAIALVRGHRVVQHEETTRVVFNDLGDDEIAAYVAHDEPMDKAGAYAIQGWASRWIGRIEGDYSNVVGLPIAALWKLLQEIEGRG